MSDALLTQVAAYYGQKLAAHGPTPAGVDWRSEESQTLRFRQLTAICDGHGPFSVIDYGCGYGELARYLRQTGLLRQYVGYDIVPEMVAAATGLHGDRACRFTSRREELQPADFTLASGVFNVKLEAADEEWTEYVLRTIREMASLSRYGFAFNALTTASDPERRRADLYYADPRRLFDFCQRQISRFVTLVHDYPLWEFTIRVRLDGLPPDRPGVGVSPGR